MAKEEDKVKEETMDGQEHTAKKDKAYRARIAKEAKNSK